MQHQIPSHSVRGERKSGGLHYSFDLDLAALLHWGLELKKTSTHTLSLINSAFNCADPGARNGFYWQWSVPLHLTAGLPREMAQGREREQKKRVQYFPPPAQPITRSTFRTSSSENGRDRLPCLPVIEATDTLLLSPWRPAAPTVELNPVLQQKKGYKPEREAKLLQTARSPLGNVTCSAFRGGFSVFLFAVFLARNDCHSTILDRELEGRRNDGVAEK